VFVFSADVFDLSLSDCCLQENEESTENGINPELAKVGYSALVVSSFFFIVYTVFSLEHSHDASYHSNTVGFHQSTADT